MRHLTIGIDAVNIRQGGGVTHLIELLSAAEPSRDKFSEIFIWGPRETLDRLPEINWLKKRWSPAFEGGILRRILWQKCWLGKSVRSEGCDILFVPGGSFGASFRPVAAMSQNILPFEWGELLRYGVSLAALRLILLRFVQARSFRGADGIIFLSNYAQRTVLQVTGPLRGMMRIIPHGLNPRFRAPELKLRQYRVPCNDRPIRLIYVSIVDQYKHQWHVVDAVAAARSISGFDLRLDLVGPGYSPSLKRLKMAILEHDPLGEWIRYHGAIEYSELHSLYAQGDIGIFASSCENLPIILLETMAAGLSVLSSNRGPMPEILQDSGLYFDPEQPASLTAVLLELLGSEDKMRTLAWSAYERTKEYSWNKCAAETFGFLWQVARARVSPRPLRDIEDDRH